MRNNVCTQYYAGFLFAQVSWTMESKNNDIFQMPFLSKAGIWFVGVYHLKKPMHRTIQKTN